MQTKKPLNNILVYNFPLNVAPFEMAFSKME